VLVGINGPAAEVEGWNISGKFRKAEGAFEHQAWSGRVRVRAHPRFAETSSFEVIFAPMTLTTKSAEIAQG
jgi:hypothetical protein